MWLGEAWPNRRISPSSLHRGQGVALRSNAPANGGATGIDSGSRSSDFNVGGTVCALWRNQKLGASRHLMTTCTEQHGGAGPSRHGVSNAQISRSRTEPCWPSWRRHHAIRLCDIVEYVGNDVEMYMENACLVNGGCTLLFPSNHTGIVIKITNISCRIIVTNSGSIVYSSYGLSTTSTNPCLFNSSFFDILRTTANADLPISVLSAQSGMLLGANRFLGISIQSTAGQVQANCSAFGVFST